MAITAHVRQGDPWVTLSNHCISARLFLLGRTRDGEGNKKRADVLKSRKNKARGERKAFKAPPRVAAMHARLLLSPSLPTRQAGPTSTSRDHIFLNKRSYTFGMTFIRLNVYLTLISASQTADCPKAKLPPELPTRPEPNCPRVGGRLAWVSSSEPQHHEAGQVWRYIYGCV